MEEKINNLAFEFSKMTQTPKPGFYSSVKKKIKGKKDEFSIENLICSTTGKVKAIYTRNQDNFTEKDKKVLAFILKLKESIKKADILNLKNRKILEELEKESSKKDMIVNNTKRKTISSNTKDPKDVFRLSTNSEKDDFTISNYNNKESKNSDSTSFSKIKSLKEDQNRISGIEASKFSEIKNSIEELNESELIQLLQMNIKKGALGLQTNLFDEYGVYLISPFLDPEIYEIVIQVHRHAEIYKKLKNTKSFQSKAQLEFYEVVRKQIQKYENSVLRASEKLLNFHVSMTRAYRELEVVNQLFDLFFDHPKNPFEFLRFYKNSIYFLELQFIDRAILASTIQINDLLNNWIYTGEFLDPGNEFFIVKNGDPDLWNSFGVDYGLVPYFLDHGIVDKILYIGKCKALLREVEKCMYQNAGFMENGSDIKMESRENKVKEEMSIESGKSVNKKNEKIIGKGNLYLDILDPYMNDYIEILLQRANDEILKDILVKFDVFKYLQFTKDVFLGFRADFMETLLLSISSLQKGAYFNKRSVSYVLDAALASIFGDNKFIKTIDICIFDDYTDYISLFCHLDFPINLIITKEVILKLVLIFKFLWKIKRIEFLLTSHIKIPHARKLRNFILKVSFYVYEEVINNLWKFEFKNIDQFRREINENLDKILIGIFQVKRRGKEQMELLLETIEKYISEVGGISEEYLEKVYYEFLKFNNTIISSSSISDIKNLFLKTSKE